MKLNWNFLRGGGVKQKTFFGERGECGYYFSGTVQYSMAKHQMGHTFDISRYNCQCDSILNTGTSLHVGYWLIAHYIMPAMFVIRNNKIFLLWE